MGKIEQGYLGGFRGKLGTAVGSKWKGINVIRSRPPKKRTAPPSELQLEVQAKFELANRFLRPLNDLLEKTFKKAAVDMSGFNAALSENLPDAIAGDYPNITIDYSKVMLSKGGLAGVPSPAAASTAAGKLTFTWTDNSGKKNALSSDLVFVTAYNEQLNEWDYDPKIAARSAGTCTLDVAAFSGKPVQTYIGLISADGKKIATSQYTGVVNIQ